MIHEYPLISIDEFRNPEAQICILGHAHEDHTPGLARKSFNQRVYCSQATKSTMLALQTSFGKGEHKYRHLTNLLTPINPETPTKLKYLSHEVIITLISTTHCPGSNIILIQSDFAPTVIYTGDIRLEPSEIELLNNSAHLSNLFSQSVVMYVDSTFMNHEDPHKPYELNHDGTNSLINVLKHYPAHMHFCICDLVTGHEPALIQLAKALATKIHMDEYFINIYKSAQTNETIELLQHVVNNPSDPQECRIHYCHKSNGCVYKQPERPSVYFKACNQPPKELVEMQNQILDISTPSGMLTPTSDPDIYEGPTQRYYKFNSRYYPLFPFYYFSRHTSMPEMKTLIAKFNCCKLYTLNGKPLNFHEFEFKPGLVTNYFDKQESTNKSTQSQILELLNGHTEFSSQSTANVQIDTQGTVCGETDDTQDCAHSGTIQDHTSQQIATFHLNDTQNNQIEELSDTIPDNLPLTSIPTHQHPHPHVHTQATCSPPHLPPTLTTSPHTPLKAQLQTHPSAWFDLSIKCLNK